MLAARLELRDWRKFLAHAMIKPSSSLSSDKPDIDFRSILSVVCVTGLCYLVPKLAAALISNPLTVWPLWPGNAILVSGLLLVPFRIWPLLIPAALAAFGLYDLAAGVPVSSIVWFLPADAVQDLIAAFGLRYCFNEMPRLDSMKALAKYSFIAVVLAPFTAAFLSAPGIGRDYWSGWRIAFLSEVLAFVTVTPAIFSWLSNARAWRTRSRAYYVETIAQLIGVVLFGFLAFTTPETTSSPALLYSLLPFLLWAALRLGLTGVSSSVTVVAFLSIWGAVHGRGPFIEQGPLRNPLWLQVFLVFAATPFMVLAVAVEERKAAQEEQRESEARLRLLLDSTAEAIYGIDLEHRCTFCNPACLRTLGYEHAQEVLGKNMHDLIHHTRADGTKFPLEECRVHRVIRTGEEIHAEDEVFWRANGTVFPVEYWSHPQRKGHEVVGVVIAFIDITERKLAESALANVSRKLIEAQEQERTRIGRELHDDVGQRLAMVAIGLQQLHDTCPIVPEVRSRTGELQKQILEIATDIQSLSHELHSAKLQYLGLAGAMRGFCREFGEHQKVEIDIETHDLPDPLSPDISLTLFRVLQEGLHNSAKHSGVRSFEVRLWGTSDEIHLSVSDSGGGFNREAAKERRGLGLISMEERLKVLKGTLSIDSQPNRGTTIHARVPLGSAGDSMRAAG